MMNLGCLLVLGVGLIALFAGYPLVGYFMTPKQSNLGAYNTGGTNATGQVPVMTGNFALIDADTPADARTKKPYHVDGPEWDLVFSDEFNVEGRSFYPGDDPFWEAVDLHYWGTNNLEWYDPSMVTTVGGALQVTLDRKPNHDLNYMGGLISSWNKFCFTGGLIEASVSLPGRSDVFGLWPALWTMGNLGRAGFGASLDGMWPYSYDSCDVGTMPNQTRNGLPTNALTMGDKGSGGTLSYLPGQRLSRCTCKGEAHPGPIHADGTPVGRSAPEIDILEAQVTEDTRIGMVSQSCQWAPFDANYEWDITGGNLVINDATVTTLNVYKGGVFQQASSAVSVTDQNCYTQMPRSCFSIYGFEYKAGGAKDGGYITWINNAKPAWTILSAGMAPNTLVEIGERPIPQEPLYMIVNLGISRNFGAVDEVNLVFPTTLLVDWIRVYQPRDAYNVGCSPPNFPTEDYINTYIEAYTNPNLTTWAQYNQENPKNSFAGQCATNSWH
jgi:beta-glucanase (GH16 family)